MRAKRDHKEFLFLLDQALRSGAERPSQMRVIWDISGNCSEPYTRELYAAPPAEVLTDKDKILSVVTRLQGMDYVPLEMRAPGKHAPKGKWIVVEPGSKHPFVLELSTRCRRCERCRRARALLWTHRAMAECRAAPRTWFGTLTLNATEQQKLLDATRLKLHQQGLDLEALDLGDQFRERCGMIGREITLYLKRVRKSSMSPLRYLWVAEQHKSGNPHFHCLVHEVDPSLPVRHAVLSDQWKLGFTRFKLIDDPKRGAYVCKYLAKSAAARVRASIRYGDTTVYHHSLSRFLGLEREQSPPPPKRKGGGSLEFVKIKGYTPKIPFMGTDHSCCLSRPRLPPPKKLRVLADVGLSKTLPR